MTEPSAPDAPEGLPDAATRRSAVRERYGSIATGTPSGGDESRSCCSDSGDRPSAPGYSADERTAGANGAALSLGCGNPVAIAGLEAGDTVLDLGAGGGFDCFLAAREVGPDGRVIGVDMTPEMVERARENAEANDAPNVEFRLGEIEHLPVADASVDVILSNCVVNLSADKPRVFEEAYRVLRPGGRLAVSDVVLRSELPAELRTDPRSLAACVAGAASVPALESMLRDAGFSAVTVTPDTGSEPFIREWDDELDLSNHLVAARIEAEKPAASPPTDA